MMTDTIADMLTRMRNALAVRKESVDVPASRMKQTIADILQREGYIRGVAPVADGHALRIALKYDASGMPSIRHLKRLSTPGRRTYAGKEQMPRVLGGIGIAIVSTSSGIMTDTEARKKGVGGELLCEIY